MATIVRGYIPASEFVLEETLTTLQNVEFECERIIESGDDAVMPLLWVRGVDGDTVEQALEDDPTVENVDLLSSFEDEQLYRMDWVGQVQLVLQMITNSDATIMDAYGTDDQWYLRVLYPTRDSLSKTTEFGEEHGLTFTIETIREMDAEPAGRYGLTTAQYEALAQAVDSHGHNLRKRSAPRNCSIH
jgi:predicted DNA binding protein